MNQITLKNYSNVQIEIMPEAFQRKIDILKSVKMCPAVISDEFGEQTTVEALREVKSFRRDFEKSRKETKDEPLKTCKDIDRKSAEFDRELEASQILLEANLSARDKEKRRIAQEIEDKRLAELKLIEDEKARIAEEERKAQEETNRKLNEAKSIEQAQEAIQEQRRQQEIIDQRKKENASAAIENVTRPTFKIQKIDDTKSKEVDDFEVLDIHEVYKHHPELVKMEIKRADTLTAIRFGMRECTGLRIWSERKTTAKV